MNSFFPLSFLLLVVINENNPFREWFNNRLMPYVDYFTVPLEKNGTDDVKI